MLKGEMPMHGQADLGSGKNHREVKGIEASHAPKCASNSGKRKVDQQQEAKLGKKRSRQTMFLNLEDVKQAGPMKSSIPRKQTFLPPITTRVVKEIRITTPLIERAVEKQQASNKDLKQEDMSCDEGGMESGKPKSDSDGDGNSGLLARSSKLNSNGDFSTDPSLPPFPRQGLWKQPIDSRQLKNAQVGNRKPAKTSQNSMEIKIVSKKHLQATWHTPVERLIREVTNEKFWHTPGMEDNFPSTSGVDSVNHTKPEGLIDLYLCDGWRQLKLAEINKSKCQDLADLAQGFSIVWKGNWKTLKDFTNRDLPKELGTVKVMNWAQFGILGCNSTCDSSIFYIITHD